MIGYYVHHQGRGHWNRAASICARLREPVTVLTSLRVERSDVFAHVVTLPLEDLGHDAPDPTAGGALHWAPLHDNGLRTRMHRITEWIEAARPSAMVVDVSVEVATLCRLLGVPVVVVAMPGERTDFAHDLVYRLADHVVAAWPGELCEPTWLRGHRHKTTYVGGISRFDGRSAASAPHPGRPKILVVGGAGGSSVDADDVAECARSLPQFDWTAIGVAGSPWVEDPWAAMCSADVIVAHAGQSSIADIAAARRPAIILPEPRPFDEQCATADALARAGLAVTHPGWPDTARWPDLIECALRLDVDRWDQWRTEGSATRAADAVHSVSEGT